MEKQVRFVVTFYNTHGAYAFQAACEQQEIEGRLIPIPHELKAGCGMVWSAPLSARKKLMALLDDPDTLWCERTIMRV